MSNELANLYYIGEEVYCKGIIISIAASRLLDPPTPEYNVYFDTCSSEAKILERDVFRIPKDVDIYEGTFADILVEDRPEGEAPYAKLRIRVSSMNNMNVEVKIPLSTLQAYIDIAHESSMPSVINTEVEL